MPRETQCPPRAADSANPRPTTRTLSPGRIAVILVAGTVLGCRGGDRVPRTVPAQPTHAAAPASLPQTPGVTSSGLPLDAPIAFKTPSGRVITASDSGEIDSYETPGASLAATSDLFEGKDRRAAKLSIASAPVEKFASVQELIDSLESDEDMSDREPPISRAPTSRRVAEERRNVSVEALLAAASREEDNDFHLIVCDDPGASSEDQHCLNIEVSGLPASGVHRQALRDARGQFATVVGGTLPGQSYKLYTPPIEVRVTGSLFFDVSHKAGAVGPKRFRPGTAWEIHPVTAIVERAP